MARRPIYEIEDMGEESGREEAACDCPYLPHVSRFTPEQWKKWRCMLKWYGRGRAQGLYNLRGREARKFAQQWASGYLSNCDLFERNGYLNESEEEDQEVALEV